jgi:hypothetical protein
VEVVFVLRLLWRRRLLVVLGLVVAVGLALKSGAGPATSGGTAEVRVVVDSPQSQLVTGDPRGADSLYWRATMLALLLGRDDHRRKLASATGVARDQVAVTDVVLTAPPVPASLPMSAATSANLASEPYTLTVSVDNELPIISLDASAPDRAGAVRLVQAAVRALQSGASPAYTPRLEGLSVQPVGAVVGRTIGGGPGHRKLAISVVALLLLWCTALVTGPLVRGMRRTRAQARLAEV